jgi:hypothetical protein
MLYTTTYYYNRYDNYFLKNPGNAVTFPGKFVQQNCWFR